MKQLLSAVWRLLTDWMDPVCQNRAAVIFGKYQGHYVRLRPLVGQSGRVETWVPDPTDADRIDMALASGAAPSPTLTAPPPSSAPTLPPPLPGGTTTPPFNPAGVPGI